MICRGVGELEKGGDGFDGVDIPFGPGEGLALTIQLNDTAAVVCRCLIRRLRVLLQVS